MEDRRIFSNYEKYTGSTAGISLDRTPDKRSFIVCFLAFLLEKTLEFKLRKVEAGASPESIREALNSMNFTKVLLDKKPYLIKTKGTDLSRRILRLERIKPPANIMAADEFNF